MDASFPVDYIVFISEPVLPLFLNYFYYIILTSICFHLKMAVFIDPKTMIWPSFLSLATLSCSWV